MCEREGERERVSECVRGREREREREYFDNSSGSSLCCTQYHTLSTD